MSTSQTVKWTLAACGVLLALGVGELFVRIAPIGPTQNLVYRENYRLSSNATLQYELAPGSRDGELRISSQGLRDNELDQPKPPGVFRIAVIGDSIAFGFGVTARDTLSAQLSDLLKARQAAGIARFEVINLGVTGYNIAQVAEQLRTRAMPLQPDLIVYAYCLNDPEASSFELQALQAQLSPAGRRYYDDSHATARNLLQRSQLWLLLRYALRSVTNGSVRAQAPRDTQWEALRSGAHGKYFEQLYADPAAIARLDAGMSSLAQTAGAAHTPLVAAIFPIFVDLDQYPLRQLHERVRERFQAHAIASYDLLPLYESVFQHIGASFVLNALHPNPLGLRFAAMYLREALERDGALPRTTPLANAAQSGELVELDKLLERQVRASLAPPPASEHR